MTKNNNNIKSVEVVCYQTHICIYSCIFVCAILILSHFHMIAKKMFYIFLSKRNCSFFLCCFIFFTHTLYKPTLLLLSEESLRETVEKKKSSLWNAMRKNIYKKALYKQTSKKFVLYLIHIFRSFFLALVIWTSKRTKRFK